MSSQITIRKDGRVEGEVALGPKLVFGRHPQQADVQLEDPLISRRHAQVTVESSQVFVTDLGSVNGVKLAGQRIAPGEPFEVVDGDVVEIGPYELAFQLAGEEELATTLSPPDAAAAVSAPAAPPPPSPNLEHLLEEGISVWSNNQEVELVVADIIEETHDVKTYRLVGQEPLLFSYKPGQFVTLTLDVDGSEVKRCYSISSSPSRPHTLELTIKRVPGGLVSNHMYDHVKLGDKLRVQGPNGSFSCFTYPNQKIACIAAGSGITPIMSMCRWIVDTTADVDVIMLVSARSPEDIIFRKELELMSARHSGLQVYVTVTSGWKGTEAWTGLTGRISPQMLQMVVPDLAERHLFLCGPGPFMDKARECLKTLSFPTQNLFSESFGAARVAPGTVVPERDVPPPQTSVPRREKAPAAEPAEAPAGYEVRFSGSGVVVHTDGRGCLLELAEANGVGITPGCRMGSCLMCKVKCQSGEVRMEDNMLPDDLKSEGYVLTCVGHPASDVVLEV